MKRFISLLIIFITFSVCLFAQDDYYDDGDDYYDDVYVYSQNGAGDQFLKISLGGLFPLNFKGQLNPGGKASIGYFKFFTENLALGGELAASYNISIGEKVLVMLPLTFGVMYQPYIGKFEFPLYAEIGIANETWQNIEHFPSLATKLSAGVYYRITDTISFGLSSDFYWLPQWFKDSSKNFNGLFETAEIGLRYHF
jgi:hypothetical protein